MKLFYLILCCGVVITRTFAAPIEAVWQPNDKKSAAASDPAKILLRHEVNAGKNGPQLHLELNPGSFDPLAPIHVKVTPAVKKLRVQAIDSSGQSIPVKTTAGGEFVEVNAGEFEFIPFDGITSEIPARSEEKPVSRMVIESQDLQEIKTVSLTAQKPEEIEPIDLAPRILPPPYQPSAIAPGVKKTDHGFVVTHPRFEAHFETVDGLKLTRLINRYSGKETLLSSEPNQLFLVEANGVPIDAAAWKVTAIEFGKEKSSVRIAMEHSPLKATLTIFSEAIGMKLGLSVAGPPDGSVKWKTLFPYLHGITLSDQPEDDYYLFPYFGGILHRANANLRSLYGMRAAWWQMVNLFSPQYGSGLLVRCLDEGGAPKGIALRKGKSNSAQNDLRIDIGKKVASDYLWEQSLKGREGTSIAFEYAPSTYLHKVDGTIEYPEAVLDFHQGDWHAAMETYAEWAKKVWQWQANGHHLQNAWNQKTLSMLRPVRNNTYPLFEKGEWYQNYEHDRVDIGEFNCWWKWSDQGPFGVNLNNASREAGEKFFERFRYFFNQKDPSTGKPAYMVNCGDYDYNPAMGGLDGLRRGISLAHKAQSLVQFYVCPFLADDHTRLGQEGRRLGVINPHLDPLPPDVLPNAPRDGYYIAYGKWRMCLDSVEYQEIAIKESVRLAMETGVDLIRFDVLGTGGEACHNPAHTHRYAMTGDLGAMRGSKYLLEEVRKRARAQGNRRLLLSAEYPGADFLASQLDSALSYELTSWTHAGVRPLPINFFRFAFPELKFFDLISNQSKTSLFPNVAFFNAVGVFGPSYPPPLHQILRDNGDVLAGEAISPLIPTEVQRLYANRFGNGSKEVTLFYNDRKTAVEGPAIEAGETAGHHYFDLINGKALPVDDGKLSLSLPPEGIAAVARLRSIATLESTGEGYQLLFKAPASDTVVAICDASGLPLQQHQATGSAVALKAIPQGAAYLKIYQKGFLVDALVLPGRLATQAFQ